MIVLLAVGLAAVLVGFAAFITGSVAPHRAQGMMACGQALLGICHIHAGSWFWAVLSGVWCAVAAWLWWHGGGGDGTRRRLRRLGRRFAGVRRTAPAAT